MPTRRPKTVFGLEVRTFTGKYGITIKQLAAEAGVQYSTLVDTTTGRCAGHDLIPIVRNFMNEHEDSKNGGTQ